MKTEIKLMALILATLTASNNLSLAGEDKPSGKITPGNYYTSEFGLPNLSVRELKEGYEIRFNGGLVDPTDPHLSHPEQVPPTHIQYEATIKLELSLDGTPTPPGNNFVGSGVGRCDGEYGSHPFNVKVMAFTDRLLMNAAIPSWVIRKNLCKGYLYKWISYPPLLRWLPSSGY